MLLYFGLPILTTDLDFSHYICDEAAIYFDPWDIKDVVDKILLVKNKLDLRKELKDKGLQRVSTFYRSWKQIVSDAIKEIQTLVD